MLFTLPLLILAVQAAAAAGQPEQPAYVPERVYDTGRATFADFEVMLADLARADVVLVGEQHDDPNTHRLERAILDGLRRRQVPVVLSLEMFERDVQPVLDRYLAGSIDEPEFLKGARPWPRYATDYRSLVELAKSSGWRVIAANVPRRVAADVARKGREAIDALSAEDRRLAAGELVCPKDAYFDRFVEAMGTHGGNAREEDTGRYYWSQCLKDETMAESIARAFDSRASSRTTIVHLTGAFHSDFGAGTAERTRRRMAGRRVAVVSILPTADLDTLAPAGDDLTRADYLVYTIK
jgi:uncharacterized iron-regulated protein